MSLLGSIMFLGWYTRDDRARKVRLYDFFDHWPTHARKEFDISSIRPQPESHALLKRRKGWTDWALLLSLMAISIAMMAQKGINWRDCVLAGIAGMLLLNQLLMRFWTAGVSAVAFRDAMIREDRCPACAYPLSEIPPDPADACTICPECGAAWRLPASVAP